MENSCFRWICIGIVLRWIIYDVSQYRAIPVAEKSRKTIIVPISLARISLLILARAVLVLVL